MLRGLPSQPEEVDVITSYGESLHAKDLLLGAFGATMFGVAAASGHGARAMAAGAWAAPALFLGGAALALPPLYLLAALGGAKGTANDTAQMASRALGRMGLALLGLSAPAAFFSTTVGGGFAAVLLVAACTVVGVSCIATVARSALDSVTSERGRFALFAWVVVALALGARLTSAVGKSSGLFGAV